MGDVRFQRPYQRVKSAADRAAAIRALHDDEVVAALAAAREDDPYLANVLASEAMNRLRRAGAIVQTANEGLLSQDGEGRLTYMNPAAERMLGWSQGELVGRPIHEIVHFQHEDGSPFPVEECPIARVAITGEPVRRVESVLTRKDGTMFPVEQAAAPILREGVVEGVVVTFTDITERRRAESALRQLASIVETTDDAILMYTPEGRILTWNVGARKVYGWTREEMLGRSVLDLAPPEAREHLRGILAEAASGRAVQDVEMPRVTKDGRVIDVSATITPIHDSAGRVVALSAISRDITERKRAEAARRDSEARKAAMLGASLDAIVTIDEESRILEWNPAATRIFGWSAEEAMGRDLAELIIPPQYREAHRQGIRHYLATGEGPVLGRRIELPALRKDGSGFPAEISILPLRSAEGRHFTGFLRDITEQKRAEAALRESEERFRALYDNSPNIYLTVHRSGRILSANAFGARQLGYRPEELVGMAPWDLYHPEERLLARANMERFFREPPPPNEAMTWEGRKVRKDGQVMYVREAVAPVRGIDGELTALVTCFDLSERKRVEAALEASRKQVVSILESVTDAFFALDREWRFTYVNHAAEAVARNILGADRASLLGRVFWEAVPGLRDTAFEEEYRRVMEERVPAHFEGYQEEWGVWFEVHAYPTADGIAIFFRDVTERRRTQDALEAARTELERRVRERTDELRAANEELEAFTYLVSHDLKEPLRAVDAYLRALEEDHGAQLDPDASELVRKSRSATRRLDRLLRGLLELSRMGRLAAENLRPVDVHDALHTADCAARYEHLLRERGASLAFETAPGLLVRATEPALCQVVGNLIVNALVHNPRQGPRVRVRALAKGREVEVSVHDDGPGFPPNVLGVFGGREGSRTLPGHGSGFGLLIARRMVERLGGRMRLGRSDELGGAEVAFLLPLASAG